MRPVTTQVHRGKGTETQSCLAYLPVCCTQTGLLLNFPIKLLSIRFHFSLCLCVLVAKTDFFEFINIASE